MKFRHEHKFLIEYDTYARIRGALKQCMALDNNSVEGLGYHIRSLYFDDMFESSLHEKLSGIVNRKKYRVRIYNYSQDTIKLEIKRKFNDYTNKVATTIQRDEFERIYNADVSDLAYTDDSVKMSYYLEIRNNLLRPKVIVDYYREAFVLPYNEIRVTFDTQLSAVKPRMDIFSDRIHSVALPPCYSLIMEVKYNNFLPSHIKNILERYDLTRLSVSKFLLCRDRIQ